MARPLNAPQGLSRPHPPILIAGGGERRTLPLVAKYGDACNIPPSPELPQKLELLKRVCDGAGPGVKPGPAASYANVDMRHQSN